MSQPERTHISVVAGAPQPGAAASAEPEAGSPLSAGVIPPPPPPEEPLTPDIGGPQMPNPSAEDIVSATGGSLADRMAARMAKMDATKEFPVPGWELADGSPGLILVAKTFGDRKGYADGISNEAFIAKSTHKLIFVNDDGSRDEIPGRWGPALAQMIGAAPGEITKAADLVARVISKPDPANKGVRIPNVAAIGGLAVQIINWSSSGTARAEETLGE